METENGSVQENRYDAENLRFELLENGKRTRFVYHDGELLHEEEGKENRQTSYHLGTGIDAFSREQKVYYYQQDEQLSTAFITGRNGTVHNSYQYDAFGNELETAGQLPNRIRYTGQQYDDATGQYYLRARYYNTILGRCMQEDTYQGDGLNLYAYCKNNSVVYYDPSGYVVVCETDIIAGDGVSDSSSIDYKKVFFDKHPELQGKVIVHHSIEQQVLKRYPGLFTKKEINNYEMLRGIPKGLNSEIHLSKIRKEWNIFYNQVDAGEIPLTKDSFLKKAKEIDRLYGEKFNPPK